MEEGFNFIQHTYTGGRYEDRITITHSRSIGLPKAFFDDNHVEKYSYASLYYDKNKNAVGIVFTNDEVPGKIKITRNNKGYGGQIPAISFFKANRINTKKYAGRYDYEKRNLRDVGLEKDGQMYIIMLQDKESSSESS